MIPCTGDCVYQQDGLCNLEQAASEGSDANGKCGYRILRKPVKQQKQAPSRPL